MGRSDRAIPQARRPSGKLRAPRWGAKPLRRFTRVSDMRPTPFAFTGRPVGVNAEALRGGKRPMLSALRSSPPDTASILPRISHAPVPLSETIQSFKYPASSSRSVVRARNSRLFTAETESPCTSAISS